MITDILYYKYYKYIIPFMISNIGLKYFISSSTYIIISMILLCFIILLQYSMTI